MYAVTGFKLYSLAKQSMNQVKEISVELNSPSLVPKKLKKHLISLNQSIYKIDAALSSPISPLKMAVFDAPLIRFSLLILEIL